LRRDQVKEGKVERDEKNGGVEKRGKRPAAWVVRGAGRGTEGYTEMRKMKGGTTAVTTGRTR
jgi:hypothetical protein